MGISRDEIKDPAWHRQHRETSGSYQLFCLYRDLPHGAEYEGQELDPQERSLPKLTELIREGDGRSRTYEQIKRLSSDWLWTYRTTVYDNYVQRQRDEARSLQRHQQARKLEQRAIQYRDHAAEMYGTLRGKVLEMLEFPVRETERHEKEDGSVVVEVHPAEWNLNTVARLINALEDLARFSAGADGGVMDDFIRKIDVSRLNDEQLEAIAEGKDPTEVIFSGSYHGASGEGDEGITEEAAAEPAEA